MKDYLYGDIKITWSGDWPYLDQALATVCGNEVFKIHILDGISYLKVAGEKTLVLIDDEQELDCIMRRAIVKWKELGHGKGVEW